MQLVNGQRVYSATDLVGFLECRHLSNLELAALEGHLTRPMRADPVLDRIRERGVEHEQRFLAELTAPSGVSVAEIATDGADSRSDQVDRQRGATLEAMRAGADVIYQATLFDGRRHLQSAQRTQQIL